MTSVLGLDFRSFAPPSVKDGTTDQRADLALHESHFLNLLAEARAHRQLYDLDPHLGRVLEQLSSPWGVAISGSESTPHGKAAVVLRGGSGIDFV